MYLRQILSFHNAADWFDRVTATASFLAGLFPSSPPLPWTSQGFYPPEEKSPDVLLYWSFTWMSCLNQTLLSKFHVLLLQPVSVQTSFFSSAVASGSCDNSSSCFHSRSALGKHSLCFQTSCNATQPLENGSGQHH